MVCVWHGSLVFPLALHVVVVVMVVVLALIIFLAVVSRGVSASGLSRLVMPSVAAARRRRAREAGKTLRAAAPLVLALLLFHWRRARRVVLVEWHQLLKDRVTKLGLFQPQMQ